MRLPLARFEHDTDGQGRATADPTDPRSLTVIMCDGRMAWDGAIQSVSPQDRPDGRLSYLGRTDRPIFLVEVESWDGETVNLRDIGPDLDALWAGLATSATALAAWHRQASFCTRCGGRNDFTHGGWEATCAECGACEYPRQDPSVIMAIRDSHDRLLLGHGATWEPGRYSCLAGFVEAGESFENAVARESLEEAGVTITRVEYVGSQPWPFPRSVMVAFRAWTDSTDADIVVDETEVAHARFFTRDEFARELAGGTITIPSRVSAGRALIEDWYGHRLPLSTED